MCWSGRTQENNPHPCGSCPTPARGALPVRRRAARAAWGVVPVIEHGPALHLCPQPRRRGPCFLIPAASACQQPLPKKGRLGRPARPVRAFAGQRQATRPRHAATAPWAARRQIRYPARYPRAIFDSAILAKYFISWQEWQGSNLRPPVLETGALPIELHSYRGSDIAADPRRSSIGNAPIARAKRSTGPDRAAAACAPAST